MSRKTLGPTQPPIKWLPGALFMVVKQLGHEADSYLYLCQGQRMSGAIPPLPQYVFMMWCLVKYRDNFTFTFTLHSYVPETSEEC